MISRRDKHKVKRANQASLLSGENRQNSSSKKIIEAKRDRWVKARVNTDSGAAGHVMLKGMCPRVKLQRKTAPMMFAAANGEQIRDVGENNIPLKTNEEGFKDASHSEVRVLSNLSFEDRKLSRAGKHRGAGCRESAQSQILEMKRRSIWT